MKLRIQGKITDYDPFSIHTTDCEHEVKEFITKMSLLSKAIYRFNAIPVNIPMTYFTDVEQTFKKSIWNHKWPQTAAVIRRK